MDRLQLTSQKGQTLLEAMVALGAAVLLISAAVVTVISALSNAEFSKNQELATQYAQEAIELVRKDNNQDPALTSFPVAPPPYCLPAGITDVNPSLTPSPCSANINGSFKRSIQVIRNDSNPNRCNGSTAVVAEVDWSDSRCPASNLYCESVKLYSCFSDANAVPTIN